MRFAGLCSSVGLESGDCSVKSVESGDRCRAGGERVQAEQSTESRLSEADPVDPVDPVTATVSRNESLEHKHKCIFAISYT